MPKGKKEKKGGKGKGKKATKAVAEREEAVVKCKLFLRAYQTHCAALDSSPSTKILKACRESVEEDKSFSKFVLDVEPDSASKDRNAKTRPKSAGLPTSAGATTSATAEAPPPVTPPSPPHATITLPPLFKALAEASYNYMKGLHVWGVPVNDDGAVSLTLFLESTLGVNLRVLELRTTDLSPWALLRLSRPLARVQLTQINLDYNEIPFDVLVKLCERLQMNTSLQTLSLNYCKLDHNSGEILGGYIIASQIRSLSLMGNSLQCNGCNELIRPMVSICESSSINAIKMDTDAPRKNDDLSLGIAESAPMTATGAVGESSTSRPTTLPPLSTLDLRDNCIDPHGACGNEVHAFEPVICMRTIKRWMISSPGIEEVNLDHNLIGDGGARELLQGLILRQEAGLPIMKLYVTVYISQDIFQKIVEYSTPPKKKKGKGKKKK